MTEPSDLTNFQPRFSVFGIVGRCCVIFCAILAGRMVFEETLLTWQEGPQMLGFSLAHGAGAILFLAPICLCAWLLVALIGLIVRIFRHRYITTSTWLTASAGVLIIATLSIPPQFWIWLFASSFARSPHAADLANYSAVRSQTKTVEALIHNGVAVNAADYEGETLIHSAAAGGDVALLRFLHERHADINALDGNGDSPLQRAMANKQLPAAQYLQSIGAQRTQGTEEQRSQNSERVVRRQIEEDMHGR